MQAAIFFLLLQLHTTTPLNLRSNLHHQTSIQTSIQNYANLNTHVSASASEAASSAPGFQEPLTLSRYPGQPPMQNDGTEGNNAYYSGNYVKAPDTNGEHNERNKGLHSSEYWHQNPYYSYFKKVWGNAPFLDANFRLWTKGYFKYFKVPNQAKSYQQTKALPAFLHYYGKTYDPLLDPPYKNEYDLFGSGGEAAASEAAAPINGETIKDDCTQSPFKNAMGYKRPCGVNEILAKSWTKAKHMLPLNNVLGKNSWWEGQKNSAGSARGSAYWTYQKAPDSPSEEGEGAWVGLDNKWGKNIDSGSESERPKNIPPPPVKAGVIPIFLLGPKKKVEEADATPPA